MRRLWQSNIFSPTKKNYKSRRKWAIKKHINHQKYTEKIKNETNIKQKLAYKILHFSVPKFRLLSYI